MAVSLMSDAFAHHNWATLRLIDHCATLDPAHLGVETIGIYGPILDTMRHLVGADAAYLFSIAGERTPPVETGEMDLAQLREVVEANGVAWGEYLAEEHDPAEVVVRRRDDGSETHAEVGVRLAQAIHHGTDHRSQICTALTALGSEPPEIDVWMFALDAGRLVEIEAGS